MMIGKLALALVLSTLLITVAYAQTETVLHSFTVDGDGVLPLSSLTRDGAGNLYGTTQYGGLGYGTVYELSPNGSGGWNGPCSTISALHRTAGTVGFPTLT
jgi:uncharacterized repeat protein (TIGR03803 family)